MEEFILCRPTSQYAQQITEYRKEFLDSGDSMDGTGPLRRMALPFCKEIGLTKILITCIDGNIGSEKTILANGGAYDATVYEPDNKIKLKRFWIR